MKIPPRLRLSLDASLNMLFTPSVLWHCWFGDRKGIWPVKWYFGNPQSSSSVDPVQPSLACCNLQQNRPNKKALRETQTLCAGCSKVEPKFFAPPHTPCPWAQDSQNLISWRWSLPLPTNPVWWGSNRQDRLQYTALLSLAHNVINNSWKGDSSCCCSSKVRTTQLCI